MLVGMFRLSLGSYEESEWNKSALKQVVRNWKQNKKLKLGKCGKYKF